MKKWIAILLFPCILLGFTVGCVPNKPSEEEKPDEKVEVFDEIEHVYITHNAEKIYGDDSIVKNGIGVLSASLARNEKEGVQFALYFDEKVENVKVTVGDITNDDGEKLNYKLYRQYYYDFSNKDIINAKVTPDVLVPMYDGSDGLPANDVCSVEAGRNQGFWITLSAESKQTAGSYKGTVTVTYGEDGVIEIPLRATVWDFEIPVTPTMETAFSAGWHNDVYTDYGLSKADVNKMAWETLMDFRLSGGMISFNPYASYGSQQEDYIKFIAEFMQENPVATVFHLPLYGFDWNTYAQRDDFSESFGIETNGVNIKMYELLKKYGLENKAYYYFLDELSYGKANVRVIQGTSTQIARFAPGVRSVMTLSYDMYHNHLSEIEAVNLWVPIITDVTEDWVRAQQEKGDTVWWYCCVAPDMPYPTYRQDDFLVGARALHWMQKDYGITGELYWATTLTKALEGNAYSKQLNLWETQEVDKGVYGDGILMVMGLEGDGIVNHNEFCPTLRLETIRDGMEDYEYLTLMENKAAEIIKKNGYNFTADEYMDTYYDAIYAGTNEYNHDAKTMQDMRTLLAEDILRNSDVLVKVSASETKNTRVVSVYSKDKQSVSAEDLTFTETSEGGYFVYSAEVSVADGQKTVNITVGEEQYTRILGSYDYYFKG